MHDENDNQKFRRNNRIITALSAAITGGCAVLATNLGNVLSYKDGPFIGPITIQPPATLSALQGVFTAFTVTFAIATAIMAVISLKLKEDPRP